jgi:hypothetical protein
MFRRDYISRNAAHRTGLDSLLPSNSKRIIQASFDSRHIVHLVATVILALSLIQPVPARSTLFVPMLGQGRDLQLRTRPSQTSPQEQQAQRDRVRAMNKERQRKLKEDTDKLLELATELKQHVDRTNEHILSVEVVKKTDEIEKLAKSIRDKMKTAYDVPQEDGLSPR